MADSPWSDDERGSANPVIRDRQKLTQSSIGDKIPPKPDISRHVGFKYDSGNPFHKNIINHLLNNNKMDKIVVHEGGIASIPRSLAKKGSELANKLTTAIKTSESGKPILFESPGAGPTRPSTKTTKPAARPAAPKKATAGDREIAGILRNPMTEQSPEAKAEAAARAAAKKLAEEQADKAARREARRRLLEEDN